MEDTETLLNDLSTVQRDISKLISERTPVIKIKSGTKVARIVKFSTPKIQEPTINGIVFIGEDKAISKVISCVEILKREIPNLFQVTNINYIKTNTEESDNDLKPKNKINMKSVISILLSRMPIDEMPLQENLSISPMSEGEADEVISKKSQKRKRRNIVAETCELKKRKTK